MELRSWNHDVAGAGVHVDDLIAEAAALVEQGSGDPGHGDPGQLALVSEELAAAVDRCDDRVAADDGREVLRHLSRLLGDRLGDLPLAS